jgi:hypothetical protein
MSSDVSSLRPIPSSAKLPSRPSSAISILNLTPKVPLESRTRTPGSRQLCPPKLPPQSGAARAECVPPAVPAPAQASARRDLRAPRPAALRSPQNPATLELLRRMAQQPSLQRRARTCQPRHVQRASEDRPEARPATPHRPARHAESAGASRAISASHQASSSRARQGHLCQVVAELRVPALQQRQQLMPDAVPRETQMPVRRVLPPALADFLQISLHLGAARPQQRTQNRPSGPSSLG